MTLTAEEIDQFLEEQGITPADRLRGGRVELMLNAHRICPAAVTDGGPDHDARGHVLAVEVIATDQHGIRLVVDGGAILTTTTRYFTIP